MDQREGSVSKLQRSNYRAADNHVCHNNNRTVDDKWSNVLAENLENNCKCYVSAVCVFYDFCVVANTC